MDCLELSIVKGIGKKTLSVLNDNNIYSINDLLYFFPKSYDIFEENPSLLRSEEFTLIRGHIDSNPVFLKQRRNSNAIIFYFSCYGNRIKCIIFGGDFLRYQIIRGKEALVYGRYNSTNKEFVVSKEWMLLIAYFRGRIEEYKESKVIKKLLEEIKSVDVIVAPIADNTMYSILDDFISGIITDEQCLNALSANRLGKQYVFLNNAAIDRSLKMLERCYYCNEEKKDYLKEKEKLLIIN